MSRFTLLMREALINLRRNLLVVVGAVLAIFISLSLAFAALVLNELVRTNTLAWQHGVHIIAFLWDEGADGVPSGAHATLLTNVETFEEVERVFYCDKACAYLEYQEMGLADDQEIDPSVLPASIRIELNDIGLYRDVTLRLNGQGQIVREVNSFGEQIEQLDSLSQVLNLLFLGLALVLGTSAVVLIANTIRMAIYARRDEVSIMKLVGASNWYIRVPFILEGLIEGLIGAGLAVLTVWVASRNLRSIGETIQIVTLTVPDRFFLRWGVLFLLFGAGAGVLGSVLGLSRYLRDEDEGNRPVGVRRVLEPT